MAGRGRRRTLLPSSWGAPIAVCHVLSTPAGPRTPDPYSAAAWPLVCVKQRLPRKVFRRSIAWLSVSLSTLRRTGRPASTQDALPAAGQALLDGLLTRRAPTKGFRVAPYISSSFPKLCLAQTHRPQHFGSIFAVRWLAVRLLPSTRERLPRQGSKKRKEADGCGAATGGLATLPPVAGSAAQTRAGGGTGRGRARAVRPSYGDASVKSPRQPQPGLAQ
jgi:hypothetical protein